MNNWLQHPFKKQKNFNLAVRQLLSIRQSLFDQLQWGTFGYVIWLIFVWLVGFCLIAIRFCAMSDYPGLNKTKLIR